MAKLKLVKAPVVDSYALGEFVEEVYGRKYSAVQGLSPDEFAGNGSYIQVDVEQWEADQKWMEENGGSYSDRGIPFSEWEKLEGWNAHNSGPHPAEMVWHLIKDGHDVPSSFILLVDW